MNKYFKKFSIMFVMALAIIGFGAIQNGSVANAEVGQRLPSAENGWRRYNDTDGGINYSRTWKNETGLSHMYENGYHSSREKGNEACFKFVGSKIRLFEQPSSNRSKNISIYIDDKLDSYNAAEQGDKSDGMYIVYENIKLNYAEHSVRIYANDSDIVGIDCIDIDDSGYLVESSLKLDNTTLTVPVGNTQQLTATTTPAAVGVTWKSSDESIATVDKNTGKITAIKEGKATITATTTATTGDGKNLSATCIVTVTPKGTNPVQPTEPTNPGGGTTTGDGNLFIELVDGQIKSYQVTASQIEDFKQWYLDRDNTKSNKPYYHFAKGSYNDYVIHDKIDWFEVR